MYCGQSGYFLNEPRVCVCVCVFVCVCIYIYIYRLVVWHVWRDRRGESGVLVENLRRRIDLEDLVVVARIYK